MVLPTLFLGVWGATSLKIISGDLCGRNDLKSKVSTLEELYDFFSKKYSKITSKMWFLEPVSYTHLDVYKRQAYHFTIHRPSF